MARDSSRRPTPRKRSGSAPRVSSSSSGAPGRQSWPTGSGGSPRPPKPAKRPKGKAARGRGAGTGTTRASATRSGTTSTSTKRAATTGAGARGTSAPKASPAATPGPARGSSGLRGPKPSQGGAASGGSGAGGRRQKPSRRQKTPVGSAPRATSASRGGTPAPSTLSSRGTSARAAAAVPRSSRPAFLEHPSAPASRPAKGSPRAASGAERRQRHQRMLSLRAAGAVAGCLVAVAVALGVAFLLLRDSTVFSIESVEVEPTEHVSDSDLQNLVSVPVGSTLLNLDEQSVREAIMRDPWVADVTFERVFPHTLKINVIEQDVRALVVMNTGSVAWYLGTSGTWIQPTSVEAAEDQSVDDAALSVALEAGCLLITDVPASVSPVAGSEATDDVLEAVQAFCDGFSDSFSAQVTCYSAPATDSISCTLANGVEVLLGSASDISAKEQIVTETLEELADGSVTYINVRVVSDPAVRVVKSDNIGAGSGVVSGTGSADDGTDGGSDAGDGSGDGDGGNDAAGDDGTTGTADDAGTTDDASDGDAATDASTQAASGD